MIPARQLGIAAVPALLVGLAACKFPELPPLEDDGGGTDATPVACVDMGPDSPDPSCPPDRPLCVDGTCGGRCGSDADCSGRPAVQSVCHVSSGSCVACDEDDEQAQPATSEDDCTNASSSVCDSTSHTCRACAEHAECYLGVCDAGRCASANEIIFMSANGSDGANNCDNPAPAAGCLTLSFALGKVSTIRKFIAMEPSATPYLARATADRAEINGIMVRLIGYGAELRRSGIGDGEVIEVSGGASVVIEGLTIRSATGAGVGIGIKMSASALDLFRVRISANQYRGIEATSGGTLHVRRSIISNNGGGGILFDGTSFVLINNLIVGNGNMNTSAIGGLDLYASSTTTPSTFEFNTVAENTASSGTPHGVRCNSVQTVASRNNIVTSEAVRPHVVGGCVHQYTLFGRVWISS